jgi:hypothetical protein
MQKRAGLLFLAKNTRKILLILENQKWTVPTFSRQNSLLEDARELLDIYTQGRIVPIELYLSEDNGFEYGTYVCLVEKEFMSKLDHSYSWCKLDDLPKHLHFGLSTTLNNKIIKTKIETILELNL